jgi:Protein kinase domain
VSGMVLGTPAYMAPEQARGDLSTDARADVYSVGAVLYHMLTGAAPYVGDDPATLLARVASEDPPPPRRLDQSLPEALDRLVMRALARSPGARPQSVADLERELEFHDPSTRPPEVARDTVIDAPPSTPPPASVASRRVEPPPQTPSPTQPPRWSQGGTAVLVVAFAAIVGATLFDAGELAMRLASAHGKVGNTETAIVGAIAVVAALITLGIAARAASARWSAPLLLGRLGSTLASSSLALLAGVGLAAILWSDGSIVGLAPDARAALKIELVLVVAPLLLGVAMFATGLSGPRGEG